MKLVTFVVSLALAAVINGHGAALENTSLNNTAVIDSNETELSRATLRRNVNDGSIIEMPSVNNSKIDAEPNDLPDKEREDFAFWANFNPRSNGGPSHLPKASNSTKYEGARIKWTSKNIGVVVMVCLVVICVGSLLCYVLLACCAACLSGGPDSPPDRPPRTTPKRGAIRRRQGDNLPATSGSARKSETVIQIPSSASAIRHPNFTSVMLSSESSTEDSSQSGSSTESGSFKTTQIVERAVVERTPEDKLSTVRNYSKASTDTLSQKSHDELVPNAPSPDLHGDLPSQMSASSDASHEEVSLSPRTPNAGSHNDAYS